MEIERLLDGLFPEGYELRRNGWLITGSGSVAGRQVALIGTLDAAPIGVELAHLLAGEVLRVIRSHPGRPILLLVDTQGQRLSHRDELLGLNGYMAHLAKCLALARQRGHRIIGLVHSQAVSGGFLASSMLADACYALPAAEIRVMNLPAMARVTKIPLERLESLGETSPVFAPGVGNYQRMGAIEAIWEGDLAGCLIAALDVGGSADRRRELGEQRGGRQLARQVADRVRHDPAC